MHLQPDFPAAAASVASAGLAVLRGFLSPDQVMALRNTADALACDARAADEATAGGSDLGPDWAATHRGCILETAAGAGMPGTPYACARTDPGLGRLLAGLGAAILGGGGGGGSPHRRPLPPSSTTIRLLNEQFIIKPPHCPASGFAWHTDGQYAVEVGRRAVEEEERGGVAVAATTSGSPSSLLLYLSVWVPLDAVGPANGTLDVGWEAARVAGLVADEEAEGGQGDPPPATGTTTTRRTSTKTFSIVAAPGDAVALLSTTPHGSGPNLGAHARRVWMPQIAVCAGVGGVLAGG